VQFEQTWARDFWGSQVMKDYIVEMDTTQRNLLGFPAPGHRYWTERTIAAVQDRYVGMDMADYRAALRGGGARM